MLKPGKMPKRRRRVGARLVELAKIRKDFCRKNSLECEFFQL